MTLEIWVVFLDLSHSSIPTKTEILTLHLFIKRTVSKSIDNKPRIKSQILLSVKGLV